MAQPPTHLVVFVGPSLDPATARELLPSAEIAPPIARGDLERHMAAGARAFLIIDGVFAHRLAAAPSEFVSALDAGAHLVGAASMGAIRAAECRPAGMRGVGAVYQLYRWRVISNDDEVAVAVDPDDGFAAVSDALINIRWGLLTALRMRLLTRAQAAAVLTVVHGTDFAERRVASAFECAGVPLTPQLGAVFESADIKRRDALQALGVGRLLSRAGERALRPAPSARRTRAAGHDPMLGYPEPLLRREVPRWLLATGRHRRYLPSERCGEDVAALCGRLWTELRRTGAADGEIMRWHAVQCLGADRPALDDGPGLAQARTAVASAHGCAGWEELTRVARSGRLDGIPLEWVEQACRAIARARRAVQPSDQATVSIATAAVEISSARLGRGGNDVLGAEGDARAAG